MSFQNFTLDQKKAVQFAIPLSSQAPHLVIEAGAGAGKTHVLIERVKRLVTDAAPEQRIHPSQLFLVTFTKDAQAELQERLEKALHDPNRSVNLASHIHISTIDSLFAMLVDCLLPAVWEKTNVTNRMPPRISLVSESAVCQKLERVLFHFLNSNGFTEKQLSLVIDFVLAGGFRKNDLIQHMCQESFLTTPIQNIRIAAQKIHPATEFLLAEIHKIARQEYANRLAAGEMTYADRTVFLKEHLTHHVPFSLKELIVDEYQDTNHIQHDILYKIATMSKARMVVVGDPKQSIYGFRGASVDVLKGLIENPQWNHIVLNKNFRSTSAVLSQINTLSSIAFQWSNPKNPKAYEGSFFHRLAQKKQIAESPLIAKETVDTEQNTPCVYLVSQSLTDDKKLYKNMRMELHALHSYAHFLKNFQKKKNIPWSDIVILCEKNAQIQKFMSVLKSHAIPVSSFDVPEKRDFNALEDLVSLALCKYLTNTHDTYDLWVILQSPLSSATRAEVEDYFATENKSASLAAVLELLEVYQKKSQDHFFRAWQCLRWQLVFLHTREEEQKNAALFCAHMNFFAQALYKELSNINVRQQMETRLCGRGFPLSEDLKNWEILKTSSHSVATSHDGVVLKTVHKAKGLQWPYVCFYPKYGLSRTGRSFTLAQTEQFVDITWLNSDVEKLSLVSRVANEKFCNEDFCQEDGKKYWFSELRQKSEEDFERQRIFYTAFTRAEKCLILFQPEQAWNTKTGVTDIAFDAKKSFVPQDYLEKDVYTKFVTLNFEGQQDTMQKNSLNVLQSADGNAELHDYRYPHNLTETSSQEVELLIPNGVFYMHVLNMPTPVDGIHPVLPTLEDKSNQRALSHAGIVYHATAEHTSLQDIFWLEQLKAKAIVTHHEFECWKTLPGDDTNTSRHILDLLVLIARSDFEKIFPDRLLHTTQNHIALVVDFKTGQKEDAHKEQIKTYLSLCELLFPEDTLCLGCVFYAQNKHDITYFFGK